MQIPAVPSPRIARDGLYVLQQSFVKEADSPILIEHPPRNYLEYSGRFAPESLLELSWLLVNIPRGHAQTAGARHVWQDPRSVRHTLRQL